MRSTNIIESLGGGMQRELEFFQHAIYENEHTEWGFDLTDFGSPEVFKKLLKTNDISDHAYNDGKKWIWRGSGVTLYTANNPITGEYARKGMRDPQPGYASYIGIEGEIPSKVQKLAKMIKQIGDSKDESPGRRDFI